MNGPQFPQFRRSSAPVSLPLNSVDMFAGPFLSQPASKAPVGMFSGQPMISVDVLRFERGVTAIRDGDQRKLNQILDYFKLQHDNPLFSPAKRNEVFRYYHQLIELLVHDGNPEMKLAETVQYWMGWQPDNSTRQYEVILWTSYGGNADLLKQMLPSTESIESLSDIRNKVRRMLRGEIDDPLFVFTKGDRSQKRYDEVLRLLDEAIQQKEWDELYGEGNELEDAYAAAEPQLSLPVPVAETVPVEARDGMLSQRDIVLDDLLGDHVMYNRSDGIVRPTTMREQQRQAAFQQQRAGRIRVSMGPTPVIVPQRVRIPREPESEIRMERPRQVLYNGLPVGTSAPRISSRFGVKKRTRVVRKTRKTRKSRTIRL